MEYLDIAVGGLNNAALLHLGQQGYAVHARRLDNPDILIFARQVPMAVPGPVASPEPAAESEIVDVRPLNRADRRRRR